MNRYVLELRRIVRSHDFRLGDSIIDFSGIPGNAYVLGASPLGVPWLLTGYKGSENFVNGVLSNISCQKLLNAWVIMPLSKKDFEVSLQILKNKNIDFYNQYKAIGIVTIPNIFQAEIKKIVLYKPKMELDHQAIVCKKSGNRRV